MSAHKKRRVNEVHYTRRFLSGFSTLTAREQKAFRTREAWFRGNAFDGRLRTHKLSGRLKNYYAFSVTHSVRVLFRFLDSSEVIFYDIGHHDIYR